jgi:hypothetical protein
MSKLLIENTELDRKINRIKLKIREISIKHKGKELEKLTYHAGHALGYWKGKLAALEEFRDEIDSLKPQN